MAKKKEEQGPPGLAPWMATFSDLMNLLLCFFVMLFSMSTIDEAKLNELIASMNSAFSVFDSGSTAIGEGILISNGVSQLNELSEYINSTGKTAESENDAENLEQFDKEPQGIKEILEEQQLKENEQLAEMIEEAIAEGNMSDRIEVNFTSQYVQLTMKGAILFDSGKAELKSDALPVVEKVALILDRYAESTIEIEGHTDNVPISTSKFESNDVLSSYRALAMFDYLVQKTSLDPSMLKHSGRGEYIPVADNSTPEGRAKNRRIEIKIYNTLSGE